MVDSSDHITGKTGLTLTITASKDGGAFASITPTVTDLGSGWYKLALTTTHTNTLGYLALHVTGTGADPTDISIMVVTDLPGESVSSVTGSVGSVTGAVGSVTGAVGSVTGNVGGNVVGSVGSIATNGITSTSIATDAINAASVKADAVTEIVDGVWNAVRTSYTSNGSMGESMNQNLTWAVNAANASYVDVLGSSVDVRIGDIMICVAGTGIGTSDIVKKVQTHGSPNGSYIYPYAGASVFDTSSRFFFKKSGEVQNILRIAVTSTISYTTSGNTLTISGIAGSYSDNAFVGCMLEDRQYAGGTDILGIYNVISYDGTSGTFTLDRNATGISGSVSVYWMGSFGTPKVRKNIALSNFEFLMVNSSDHITPKTGLTITATRSIDGAAFSSCTNSASEVSSGIYKINLSSSDLNGDVITFLFAGSGADNKYVTIITQP